MSFKIIVNAPLQPVQTPQPQPIDITNIFDDKPSLDTLLPKPVQDSRPTAGTAQGMAIRQCTDVVADFI